MRKLLTINLSVLIICLCLSCNDGHRVIYHTYQSIKDTGWSKTDTLLYQIPPTDSLHKVILYAEVRHTLSYNYSDFYLVVKQNIADSLSWQTDTVHFTMADSIGRWTGKGKGYYYLDESYVRGIKLPPHPFHATIRVSQGLKDNIIKGISDIGFRIEYQ